MPRLSAPVQLLGLGLVGLVGVILLVLFFASDVSPMSISFGVGLFALALGVALFGMARTYPHRSVGWCNTVTVFRLVLICVLAAWLFQQPEEAWIIVVVASVAFAFDGMDGWLARREGYASDFGARFDMEVDSILAMVLAVLAFQTGEVGWYVLLLGVPRYVFFFALIAFPWLNADLPPRFSRKLVCVVQIAVLILVLAPVMPSLVANLLVLAVLAIVGWSFWFDIRWLRRNRA